MTNRIDITVECTSWPALQDDLEKAVTAALSRAGFSGTYEISLVLADNALVQELNKTYRNKDKPTNVLSFPQEEKSIQDDVTVLGDVIMAYETLEHEAREQDKTLRDHALHMAVHGVLHLVGYDHETQKQADEMESLEIKILEEIGVKNPYEAKDSVA